MCLDKVVLLEKWRKVWEAAIEKWDVSLEEKERVEVALDKQETSNEIVEWTKVKEMKDIENWVYRK